MKPCLVSHFALIFVVGSDKSKKGREGTKVTKSLYFSRAWYYLYYCFLELRKTAGFINYVVLHQSGLVDTTTDVTTVSQPAEYQYNTHGMKVVFVRLL